LVIKMQSKAILLHWVGTNSERMVPIEACAVDGST
jgi:hypothetical protein